MNGQETHEEAAANLTPIIDQINERVFGVPPNLGVGLLTNQVGGCSGALNLIVFFWIFTPDHYVTPEWVIVVLAGSVAGFYLRIERPLVFELQRRFDVKVTKQSFDR